MALSRGISLLLFTACLARTPGQAHSGFPADSAPPAVEPGPSAGDSVFRVGEELTYNVTFGPVDIGQIRITLTGRHSSGRDSYYTGAAKIDSYKGVPFVNLHAVYEDHISDGIYSSWFHSRKKDGAVWVTHEYTYDYPRHRVMIAQGTAGSPHIDKRDTLRVDTLYQDGFSLFFLARTQLLSNRTMDLPTLVNERLGTTRIKFSPDRVAEKIGAVDYPVDLIHFEGNAGFVGVLGLSGDFEGWFSNDGARVPIIAKMKVLIGNVRIELMKWKRPGWEPPRAPEGGGK
jgi:hypothetical protein